MQNEESTQPVQKEETTATKKGGLRSKLASGKQWFDKKFNNAIKGVIRFGFRTFFGAKVKGLENLAAVKGQPTLIVANHISFMDGVLLASMLPADSEPVFAINAAAYEAGQKRWLYRFLMSRMDMCPIDETKAVKLRGLADKIKEGRPVVLFPEGRLTTSGSMMQIFEGSAFVADESKATIVPVHLKGLEFMGYGMTYLNSLFPGKWFPKLEVTVTKPQKLDVSEDIKGKNRRVARLDQLKMIMKKLPVSAQNKDKTLMDEMYYASRHFGHNYAILNDMETDEVRRSITYGNVMVGACALGDQFRRITTPGEFVGYLLPNSAKAAIAFWGLQEAGCVPAMLNASSDIPTIESCAKTAALKTIVTSRKFISAADPKLKLPEKVEALAKTHKIVYMEDIKANIGTTDGLKAKRRANRDLSEGGGSNRKGSDPAVIIFTSGSEGVPKGVALSSANILSNVAQMSAITTFSPQDRVFNAMPTFHSFGLVGGMLLPMLKGMPSYQFPTPLAGKIIPRFMYFYDTTITFATNTFLKLYARNATDEDMSSLRKGQVFAGAEALEESTVNTYFERFGVRIQEGYGMTEASPVVAVNVPGAYMKGTVGKFLPGLEVRPEAMPGMEATYSFSIKGPNVMLGYIKSDNPGVIQKVEDGWHNTGDLIKLLDKDGRAVTLSLPADGSAPDQKTADDIRRIIESSYVKYAGRIKRIAKPGGEMVSLDNLEAVAKAASPKTENAIIAYKAPEEGDRIVLFTTDPSMSRDKLTQMSQEMKRSPLGLPKKPNIHVIKEMPKLATGKTDYVKLAKMYQEILDYKSATAAAVPEFNKASSAPDVAPEEIVPPVKPQAPKPPQQFMP